MKSRRQSKKPKRSAVDEISAVFGQVPDFFQVLLPKPSILEGLWRAYNEVVLRSKFPEKLRGMIRYEVARADGCPLCRDTHKDLLRMYGLSDEEIYLLDKEVKETHWDDKTKHILTYSYAIASDPHREKKTVDAFKALGISDQELVEIASIVHLHKALVEIAHSLGLHAS